MDFIPFDIFLENPVCKKQVDTYKYIISKRIKPRLTRRVKIAMRLLNIDCFEKLMYTKLIYQYNLLLLSKIQKTDTRIGYSMKKIQQSINLLDNHIKVLICTEPDPDLRNLFCYIYEAYHNFARKGYRIAKNRFRYRVVDLRMHYAEEFLLECMGL